MLLHSRFAPNPGTGAFLDTPLQRPLFFNVAPWKTCASERASAACAASGWGRGGFPMFIEIHQLELQPLDFEEEYPAGTIDFGPDITQRGGLQAAGRAELIEEHHGKRQKIRDIRLKGEVATALELACARCLEPVVEQVDRSFDLLYRPLGVDAGQKELTAGASSEGNLSRGLQRTLPALR